MNNAAIAALFFLGITVCTQMRGGDIALAFGNTYIDGSSPSLVDDAFGCGITGDCVIAGSRGGSNGLFIAAAREVKAQNRRVVIAGECESACVLFADYARPNVCVRSAATFALHKTRVYRSRDGVFGGVTTVSGFTEPPHAKDILEWVQKRGGFPKDGYLLLAWPETARFWRVCQ